MQCSYNDAARPVLGRLVIANFITVTTDSEISIHKAKGKGHKSLFVKSGHEVHNEMPMLPSEKAMLLTARILSGSVTEQLERLP